MSRAPRSLRVGPAGAAAVLVGIGSLLIARPLGYDAYAWMVWARELTHGTLDIAGGPAFKPLPVLAAAPLTPLSAAAPVVWLAAMRIAALLSLFVAYRLGTRLAGWTAGAMAAALIATGPDLYRTALYGSSEPLLVLLVLLSAERWVAGRSAPAIALLGIGGLLRPELWPLLGVMAIVVTVREQGARPLIWLAAVAPPAIWLGLVWVGSGTVFSAFHSVPDVTGCIGCAAIPAIPRAVITVNEHTTALGVLRRLTSSITLPALALACVAFAVPRRTDDRPRLAVIGVVAVAWIALVAGMAAIGYPGSRRYLVAAAALLAVLAGVGMATVIDAAGSQRGRWVVGLVIAGVIVAADAHTVISDARLVTTARRIQRVRDDMRRSIALAGGRSAVLRAGDPAVNPWAQTSLAWDLDLPLSRIQPTWNSTRSHPGWAPPALVFRGPPKLTGSAPALDPSRATTRVLRFHGWDVLRASARGASTPH